MKHITNYTNLTIYKPEKADREKEMDFVMKKIPYLLESLDDSHPQMKHVKLAALEWIKLIKGGSRGISIVFCGGVGVGKTYLARCLFWVEYLELDDGTPVAPCGYFYPANDIVQLLTPGVNLKQMIDPKNRIVVIDDLGSEQTLPYITAEGQEIELQHRYFKLINYCYEEKLSLILTSNLTFDELKYHLGDRCWDRLCEMAPKGFMLGMFGIPSRRQINSGRELFLSSEGN